MPNWAFGDINALSKNKESLEKFLKLFMKQYDEEYKPHPKYFARTWLITKPSIIEYNGYYGIEHLGVKFAWSATSCLIGGYPKESNGVCPTIMEVCKDLNIMCAIQTEESMIGFEEYITINHKGELIKNECIDYMEIDSLDELMQEFEQEENKNVETKT